jgi:hypothetical protein
MHNVVTIRPVFNNDESLLLFQSCATDSAASHMI